MSGQVKRSLRGEKLARIYDAEIAPCWGDRFGKLLLRDLSIPSCGQVLDASCGTGYPALEILRRMTEGSRLIALDPSSAMLDVARRKVSGLGPLGRKAVYFRTESALPRLAFADDVYDVVVCNLALADLPELEIAISDFARVVKPGGEVRCTLPLAGTFEEFHDLYREVLVKHDRHDAIDRLDALLAHYPTAERVERALGNADLAGGVEVEEFSLLFRSSREFFYAPVIEYGPLADWKAVAGDGQDMQDVFWHIKEAIDAYYGDGPFHVTVKAGCAIGRKVISAGEFGDGAGAESITTPIPLISSADLEDDPFDDIDTGMPWPPREMAGGSVVAGAGADAPEGVDDGADDAAAEATGADDVALEDSAEQELDAFIEGKKRPTHLSE